MNEPTLGGAGRGRRRPKPGRDQTILDVSLALFVEKGFEATRIEEIAAHAGVAKGTLYLYHPSKLALLKAAIDRFRPLDAAALHPSADAGAACTDALREVVLSIWQQLVHGEAGSLLKLAVTEAHGTPQVAQHWLGKIAEPASKAIGRIVRQGMDRGEFRRTDPHAVVASLVLPVFLACLQERLPQAACVTGERLDGALFVSQHVDLVLRGLSFPDRDIP